MSMEPELTILSSLPIIKLYWNLLCSEFVLTTAV